MKERPKIYVNGVVREMTEAEEEEHKQFQAITQEESSKMTEQMEKARLETEAKLAAVEYTERVIACIDVLGWSQLIEESQNNPTLLRALASAQHTLATFEEFINRTNGIDPDRSFFISEVIQFSDTIIISSPATADGFEQLLRYVHSVVSMFLLQGVIVRGAIAVGPLYHKGSAVFGPALLAAYRSEKCEAKHPRIILDPMIAKQVGRGDKVLDPKTGTKYEHKTWRVDGDGRTFFDFLQPLGATTSSFDKVRRERFPGVDKAHLMFVRELIVRRLGELSGKPSPLSKYQWLAGYFNSICLEYPEWDIPPVVIPE